MAVSLLRKARFKWGDDGFTLVETLAALAVFSTAAVAIMHLVSENTKMARLVEQRMLSGIVADNEIVVAQLEREPLEIRVTQGEQQIGNRTFIWRRTVNLTTQAGLLEILVEAGEAEGEEDEFRPIIERRLLKRQINAG